MDSEKVEFGKWWIFTVGLVVFTVVVFAVLSYSGKVTGTMIENKVFQESYQRKSGLKAQKNRYEAELAKVNSLLIGETDKIRIRNLNSQKAMLEVQLRSADNNE